MKQFFEELTEYSHHFNQKLIDVFIDNPDKISEKAEKFYNHILNAHQIWNNRIDPKQSVFGVWELHPVQDLKGIENANYEHTLQILNKYNLKLIINYSNSKGQLFSNSIQDMLFHIINHSTYHRGQVATEFKRQGLEPLVTDYIFFKR
ncbi:MAG: damage-inducible protein DinB [Sphingobacteriales bacterium 17-39-43]|uniref:DinB family protein n=1 Tax=Daejeonella sp. TaxID=2805397 RepID=UPI000BC654D2|nr:DinB family protein [Daejeonella sp.]OYZ28896.1 MAG: damage-inducible protein DinB [Sphingobacteriales bacterium 16-39-50]OZA22245.1 MAG: damage-inducible protein DinB [Sphingobacteriales bacterium 17-39-43]HQT22504.1 DinB family protein [Daejeonella sp.]HQT59240.1 DinB family protein [Daejeonella sp.]